MENQSKFGKIDRFQSQLSIQFRLQLEFLMVLLRLVVYLIPLLIGGKLI
jgi:hypothetical protein